MKKPCLKVVRRALRTCRENAEKKHSLPQRSLSRLVVPATRYCLCKAFNCFELRRIDDRTFYLARGGGASPFTSYYNELIGLNTIHYTLLIKYTRVQLHFYQRTITISENHELFPCDPLIDFCTGVYRPICYTCMYVSQLRLARLYAMWKPTA